MLKNLNFKQDICSYLKDNFSLEANNLNFYIRALTHSSFLQNRNIDSSLKDNESLEFLGDSLIGWVIADNLFEINKTPADMTRMKNQIVQSESLAYTAKKIKLEKMLRIGTSLKNIFPTSVIENAYEAFVAAIYLDNNFEVAKKFINETLWCNFKNNELDFLIDYKTILQEIVYKRFKKRVVYTHEVIIENLITTYVIKCIINIDFFWTVKDVNLKIGEKRCAQKLLSEYFFSQLH